MVLSVSLVALKSTDWRRAKGRYRKRGDVNMTQSGACGGGRK